MKVICETCAYCLAFTKIENIPTFMICTKKQFSDKNPATTSCSDFLEETLTKNPIIEVTV